MLACHTPRIQPDSTQESHLTRLRKNLRPKELPEKNWFSIPAQVPSWETTNITTFLCTLPWILSVTLGVTGCAPRRKKACQSAGGVSGLSLAALTWTSRVHKITPANLYLRITLAVSRCSQWELRTPPGCCGGGRAANHSLALRSVSWTLLSRHPRLAASFP